MCFNPFYTFARHPSSDAGPVATVSALISCSRIYWAISAIFASVILIFRKPTPEEFLQEIGQSLADQQGDK